MVGMGAAFRSMVFVKHCIASPKIFPGGFSTYELLPLHPFATSAITPPGTKNAKYLVSTREKPQMARLGKKRKIPGEASGYWLPHWDVTNNTAITEGPLKSPLSYPARRELVERMSPAYREASRAQKMLLLDTFVALTGYVRKYAMWLLNHPVESRPSIQHTRPVHYGPEVQDALYQAWRAANQICAKRLIPFLPTLVEALERHGHLHLTEKCRSQLLSMSAATADRLLRSRRKRRSGGISTTQAGTLLKHRIPIRTFQEWNETQPGFLEADLVAHCGHEAEGGYLYTLTLTDIATGWTKCLPLLYRSRETVLKAIQHARMLFPFPILGLETDNGGEFVNEELVAYCAQEQITFTRGRPYQKRDQCNALAKKWRDCPPGGRL
jgi:hypothetical protein